MLARTSAMATRFHDAALKHYEGANLLLRHCVPNSSTHLAAEVVYLGGYAVECLLKAKLFDIARQRRHRSLEREILSELGHDLEKLRLRLLQLKKPVTFPAETLISFRRVHRLWAVEWRYSNRLVSTADANAFLESVRQVAEWVLEHPL